MKIPLPMLMLVTMLSGFPVQAQTLAPQRSPLRIRLNRRPLRNAVAYVAPRPPRNLGAPGQRSDGAGSRGCTNTAAPLTQQPLTALVPLDKSTMPNQVFAKTNAERPILWVYVPYQSPNTARFVLLNQAGETIYDTDVALPDAPGVIGLSLPDTLPPLAVGEPYHWFFNVYCQSAPPIASVDGWIQRAALPSATATQLTQLSPREQLSFYANNGLWHDALTTAAELHQRDIVDTSWSDLLQEVGLKDLGAEPIVGF